MLDLDTIRQNPDTVAENCRRRRASVDIEEFLALHSRKSGLQQDLDEIRRRRNEISRATRGESDAERRQALIEEGRGLKGSEEELRQQHDAAQEALTTLWRQIPNLTHPDSPDGDDDRGNREVRRWGEPADLDFEPKDHVDLGEALDLLDFEGGARVAGSKFYFLKNEAVLLEHGLVRLAFDRLLQEGFTLHGTPDLARTEILEGIGFNPRGEESQVYSVEGHDLCLIGTAEITLGGLHSGETIPGENLPLRLAGYSHCFRTEAGAHGRESRGLYRVHQFTKVEMFAFAEPESSDAMLESLVGIEESIFQSLEIPYRVVDTCTGDLGGPAYRKYDLEAWMPGRGKWGEVTSASNCTDYQARRLNIRYQAPGSRKRRLVHMLNGTAIATSRALVALLENHQQADGSIRIPDALAPLVGFDRIDPRR